jgi:hypothetical protein
MAALALVSIYSLQFMTRYLLLAALLAGASRPAAAQTTPVVTPTPVPRYQFCELSYQGGGPALVLRYGADDNHKQYQVNDASLQQQASYIYKLTSPTVALNYLSSQGWELVGITAGPYSYTTTYITSERVYTFRRLAVP